MWKTCACHSISRGISVAIWAPGVNIPSGCFCGLGGVPETFGSNLVLFPFALISAKLTRINEQILDLKGAAQWITTGQEEIDDFLASQSHINDVLVPFKKEIRRGKLSVCPWRAA